MFLFVPWCDNCCKESCCPPPTVQIYPGLPKLLNLSKFIQLCSDLTTQDVVKVTQLLVKICLKKLQHPKIYLKGITHQETVSWNFEFRFILDESAPPMSPFANSSPTPVACEPWFAGVSDRVETGLAGDNCAHGSLLGSLLSLGSYLVGHESDK